MEKIIWFKNCSYENKHLVGGKCSSLGELCRISEKLKFSIADGFAITTIFYDEYIQNNGLTTQIINILDATDISDIDDLENSSEKLINLIMGGKFTDEQINLIEENYEILSKQYKTKNLSVAVRSSAIAEDLPNASFAGQQDTYLNICGNVDLVVAIKKCIGSLFNPRAISYRKRFDIQINQIKISIGIQKMVRSDIGSAGVAFSLDPETGNKSAIVVNASYGLGELVVSGGVKPDEFIINKRALEEGFADPIVGQVLGNKKNKIIFSNGCKEVPTNLIEFNTFCLSNEQVIELSKIILKLETHYSLLLGYPTGIDVEWAIDGLDNKIYIVQTRPETIHSSKQKSDSLEFIQYMLLDKANKSKEIILKGIAIGDKISSGKVKNLKSVKEFKKFNPGDILVTNITTPDWEPIMKISSGIITNTGGRTSHAAIVARELGINAVVGTSNATEILKENMEITISCADGEEANIYLGKLEYNIEKIKINNRLESNLNVKLMLNLANPDSAFFNSLIPNSGVGLVRMEFIISNWIKIHPLAACDYPNLPKELYKDIESKVGFKNLTNLSDYFISKLAHGIAKIASAFYPNDTIVRLSDFKSNEYRNLLGGSTYEPNEENPMIGWRGASRYYSSEYKRGFELECKAIKYAREQMGMTNIIPMIPFCRTPLECKLVIDLMENYGLKRNVNSLQVYLMCEVPSNVIEANEFSPMIDGVSIGGNDLLQLTLGVDRDSDKIAYLSDDKNVSYRRMISMAIKTYKANGVKVGFCGQQPSDSIEFAKFLINEGIDSISVTPDSALKTIQNLSR